MTPSLLKYMLFASSALMYAYGLLSFITIPPKGDEYRSYRIARKIFGSYMTFVATCLLAHLFFDLRGENPLLATSLCMMYVIIGTMIMTVVLSSLIQGEYPFRKRFGQIAQCALFMGSVFAINYHFVPQPKQNIAFVAGAIFFIVEAVVISVQFYRMYRKAIKRADNYYSDNVGKFMVWIPMSLYFIIVLVFAGAILPFLSRVSLIPLFLLMGMFIYTFIFISLQNHMMNISKMKMLLIAVEQDDTNSDAGDAEQPKSEAIEVESRESKAVRIKLDEWIGRRGFTKQGLTLDDLAEELGTNRTYLSSYINTVYNLSFRGWIASQRIEYSKELLQQSEELSAAAIATLVGYSPNAYIKTFTKAESMPPVQWRSENR